MDLNNLRRMTAIETLARLQGILMGTLKIIVDNEKGIIFTLIDLDPPKSMTKEQIEKILGYEIDIVT